MKTSLHRRIFLKTAVRVPLAVGVAGTPAPVGCIKSSARNSSEFGMLQSRTYAQDAVWTRQILGPSSLKSTLIGCI